MIDLHSHLLPAVDDGSPSVERSLAVLRAMSEQGVTDICLTPHLTASGAEAGAPPAHDRAFAALRAAAPRVPRLHRGAEVMLDRPVGPALGRRRDVTLAGTRYILVEFHRLVAFEAVATALGRVVEAGLIPVLAHPERYSACSPEAVGYWRELGAVMQIDATTLLSSEARGERARQLLAHGLADVVAGDNHGDTRSVAAAFRLLGEQGGGEQAELLARRNPAAVLAEEPLEPVPPFRLRRTWTQRIRQLLERGE